MSTERDLDQDGLQLFEEHPDSSSGAFTDSEPDAASRGNARRDQTLAGLSRREGRRLVRRRRRGRVLATLGGLLIVVLAAACFVVIRNLLTTPNYQGSGYGSVQIVIRDGDTAADIATTLKKAGVVKSTAAFTNAANNNSASSGLQPGTYTLHKHMSGKAALNLLLDPASRVANGQLLIPEGATKLDVAKSIAAGLGVSSAKVLAAMADVSDLSLPSSYTSAGGAPTSVEGFLYPATYTIEPGSSITDVLNMIITNFASQDSQAGYATRAIAHKLTPYQMLIIASIAQSEAKFPADMAKVARVILNRLAAKMPLQIDATSAYGAKLLGLDPTKVVFATLSSPYNSYTHAGLPPTPISNPGAEALGGAANPAAGNWLYYVNSDAAGNLFFTNSATAFAAAASKCKAQGWGCG